MPVSGSADVASLYTARGGNPPAGSKVFVSAGVANSDYYEGAQAHFLATVPATI